MFDVIVQPKDFVGEVAIHVIRDKVYVDLYPTSIDGTTYMLYKGAWAERANYDTDPGYSFKLAVPVYTWLWYRFQDWRDATSFRYTGKRSWWRKK